MRVWMGMDALLCWMIKTHFVVWSLHHRHDWQVVVREFCKNRWTKNIISCARAMTFSSCCQWSQRAKFRTGRVGKFLFVKSLVVVCGAKQLLARIHEYQLTNQQQVFTSPSTPTISKYPISTTHHPGIKCTDNWSLHRNNAQRNVRVACRWSSREFNHGQVQLETNESSAIPGEKN